MNQNNKRIAKNTFTLAIQQALSMFVGLYSSRIILKSLGIADYGLYNVIAGSVAMFAFLNTSMINATQRFYNYEYGKNGEKGANIVFNNSVLIQIILSFVVLILLETVGIWYLNNKLVIPPDSYNSAYWVFQFSTLSLFFLIIQIPFSAAIAAHERMLCFAIVSILDSILKLTAAIIVEYIPENKLITYGFLIFVISISDFLIFAIYAIRNFPEIHIHKISDCNYLKKMMTFSGWNFFGSFAGVAKEQGVNLILNYFFGPVVNASRGIAYQVASALKSFVSTIMISGRPQLMQSYAQENYSRTIQLMFSLSKASFLIVFLLALPVMFNIDYILQLWLSTTLSSYTSAFVNLVIVMSLIETLSPPVSFVVHASGKMAKYQVINSSIILCILPVAYIILRLGANPASVFWLGIVFQALCQVSSVLIVKRIIRFPISDYFKQICIPLALVTIISSITGGILYVSMESGFTRLICIIFISFISTLLSSYFLVLDMNERMAIRTLLTKYLPH